MVIQNTAENNDYTSYGKDTISQLLNQPLSPGEPYLTPLYYTFPSMELANMFIQNGALVHELSFLHSYFTYRDSAPSTDSLFNFMHNLSKVHGLDCNEVDPDGKNAVAHVYEEMASDPRSVRPPTHSKAAQ